MVEVIISFLIAGAIFAAVIKAALTKKTATRTPTLGGGGSVPTEPPTGPVNEQ